MEEGRRQDSKCLVADMAAIRTHLPTPSRSRCTTPPFSLRDYNNVHRGLFIPFQVLLAFVCLIVGFAFSFAVLFHGNDQFRNLWRAVVKIVVMMMGEYEHSDLFSDEKNGNSLLSVTSRIVFPVLVVLASMVLTNLMIDIAVNDQGLEKETRSADTLAHTCTLVRSMNNQ